jgi:hypothetical protein
VIGERKREVTRVHHLALGPVSGVEDEPIRLGGRVNAAAMAKEVKHRRRTRAQSLQEPFQGGVGQHVAALLKGVITITARAPDGREVRGCGHLVIGRGPRKKDPAALRRRIGLGPDRRRIGPLIAEQALRKAAERAARGARRDELPRQRIELSGAQP